MFDSLMSPKQQRQAAHIQVCAMMATEFMFTGCKPTQSIFSQCQYTKCYQYGFGVVVKSAQQRLIGKVTSLELYRQYLTLCDTIDNDLYEGIHRDSAKFIAKMLGNIFIDAAGAYSQNKFEDVRNVLNETFTFDTSYIQVSGTKLVCGYVSPKNGSTAVRTILQHPADQGVLIGQMEVITT